MTNAAAATFFAMSMPIFVLGLLRLVYFPLAVAFELRPGRNMVFNSSVPLVTVVVPAFNEGRVLRNCVDSILASTYRTIEIVLVDDGSTDDTLAVMRCYADHPAVTVLTRPNGGKGAALNAGIAVAKGEIVLLVDADGIFTATTVVDILRGFDGPRVGAVCGNDTPVNLDRLQTRLLAVLTHTGTGFVRRALALIGCLPIVSGNLGAFRKSVLDEVGGLREDIVGEDLELTWRIRRAGYSVSFRPDAKVYAEVPSTVRGLWRQRIRWSRGFIQTVRLHRDLLFRPRYGLFGCWLPINVTSMLVVPVLQVAALLLVPVLAATTNSPVPPSVLGALGWLGLVVGVITAFCAILLDRAYADLRLLYVVPLWVVYSALLSLVVVVALWQEIRGSEARWNKLARTGVVSRDGLAQGG
ncbi:MAG TPA: glycosyltransferase family 2 protein [Pseudonocardiaceae bacterium]|nr:glycosyltransferase family 2 protein [Pseudonocardiaceae bacterium]